MSNNPMTLQTFGTGAAPVTPDASLEARALLNYLYSMSGQKTLAGQMWSPWGIDEIATVKEITGKFPAIRGQDYIHESANARENQLATEWWKAGGGRHSYCHVALGGAFSRGRV